MRENIAQFEVAQLANLCCEDAEEAKALIPRYNWILFISTK
jgi:DNA-directed RNA polymerase II subunit RPB4